MFEDNARSLLEFVAIHLLPALALHFPHYSLVLRECIMSDGLLNYCCACGAYLDKPSCFLPAGLAVRPDLILAGVAHGDCLLLRVISLWFSISHQKLLINILTIPYGI